MGSSKVIYIRGPMTGLPGHNFNAFNEAADLLTGAGFGVVNPVDLNAHLGTDKDWHVYIRNDIRALCDCDGLALLPGWEDSNGAHLELHLAHRMGLKVRPLIDWLQIAEAVSDGSL